MKHLLLVWECVETFWNVCQNRYAVFYVLDSLRLQIFCDYQKGTFSPYCSTERFENTVFSFWSSFDVKKPKKTLFFFMKKTNIVKPYFGQPNSVTRKGYGNLSIWQQYSKPSNILSVFICSSSTNLFQDKFNATLFPFLSQCGKTISIRWNKFFFH